jgi:hypothetical protein
MLCIDFEWSFAPFTYAPFIPVNYTDGRQVAMKKLTAKIKKLTKEVGRKETRVKFMFFFSHRKPWLPFHLHPPSLPLTAAAATLRMSQRRPSSIILHTQQHNTSPS